MTNTCNESGFPQDGRLLGVDYGRRRVGFAISSPDQKFSSPLENYTRKSMEADSRYINQIVQENRVAGIVVGLPVHMSGDEGELAKESREYGSWLSELTSLPVIYWDERFTSSSAEDLLRDANISRKKRKEKLDKLAAQLMLQAFLEATDRNSLPIDVREGADG